MNKNVINLEYKDKEIILIKTAHVSKESAELVKDVIESEMPDTVCIELDQHRYKSMTKPKQYQETDLIKVIKEGKAIYLLANTILSSYQRKLAKQLNTEVGLEMKTAIDLAHEHQLNIVNADRNIKTTFTRIWRLLTFKDKIHLLSALLDTAFDDSEVDLSDEDINNLLHEDALASALGLMENEAPIIKQVILDERDQYLAYKIKNAPGKKIVAVLGAAHVPGVSREIYLEQNIEKLNYIPEKSKKTQYIKYIIMVAILALLLLPFLKNGFETGLQGIVYWAFWSGGLAAIFTLLAGGHILSSLAAFFTAPLAALHPLIAVGMIVGIVEATIRKPTVADIENLSADIQSFRGWRNNKFIKALTLVLIANLGSVIGQIIAGFSIFTSLFK